MMNEDGKDILLNAYFIKPSSYHFKKLSYYLYVVKLWNALWSLEKSIHSNTEYNYQKGAYLIFEDLYNSLII